MAKHRLSIYLMKNDCALDEALDSKDARITCGVLEDGSHVLLKASTPHKPKWLGYFDGQVSSDDLLASTASALHLVEVCMPEEPSRLFAISFGYGYTLLNKEQIVERFGLRVALNQSMDGGLRKLRRTAVSENARKTDEQMPLPSSVDAFEIDVERDLLEGVTVGGGDGLLSTGSISGSDSLSLAVDENVGSIKDFLRKVYDVYKLNLYKRKYAWVDRIAPVKSRELQEGLNDRAVEMMNALDDNIRLAVPEMIEWEDVAGFRIGQNDALIDDISIESVFPDQTVLPQSYNDLRNTRIAVVAQATGAVIKTWRASTCLYGEIEYQGNSYCANNGKWYRIEKDYKKVIDDAYGRIPVFAEKLPDYHDKENEGPYNLRVAEMDPESKILMDRKNVRYGDRGSQVELCDILRRDGAFIHVKRYSGSATLSHLFNQGLVSARLIKTDPTFCVAAQKVIDGIEPDAFTLNRDSIVQVVFAIISQHGGERPEIPFFSKVALDAVASQLRAMDIDVSISRIEEA